MEKLIFIMLLLSVSTYATAKNRDADGPGNQYVIIIWPEHAELVFVTREGWLMHITMHASACV